MPATIAADRGSAGKWCRRGSGGRHQTSAPTTARLPIVLSQNGAAIPRVAMTAPPSAGPMARLMLKPTLFKVTAGARSALGTSSGTTACQAGAMSTLPTPIKNVNSSSNDGVTRSSHTRADRPAQITDVAISTTMSSRRRSTTSARAPDGSANRNIGKVAATWTIATTNGSGARPVISQLDAVLYIHVPTLETSVASHSTVNAA